jgi:hypothetical protein
MNGEDDRTFQHRIIQKMIRTTIDDTTYGLFWTVDEDSS